MYELIRKYSANEREYKEYVRSLKNSVLTAFYTPEAIVKTISDTFRSSGLTLQRFLDPSAGTGIFASQFKSWLPDAEIICFEKDKLTGKILSAIHPHADVIIDGFQTIEPTYKNYFDAIVSNIPFGDTKIFDREFDKSKDAARNQALNNIHNYFFIKGIDVLREGGILAFITSQGLMDSPRNQPIREWLVKHADLISAIRLPNNTFIESGTEVGGDLIVLQKNTNKQHLSPDEENFITIRQDNGIDINNYYQNLTRIIYTEVKIDTDLYGKPGIIYLHTEGINGIAKELSHILTQDFSHNVNLTLYTDNSQNKHSTLLADDFLSMEKLQRKGRLLREKKAELTPEFIDLKQSDNYVPKHLEQKKKITENEDIIKIEKTNPLTFSQEPILNLFDLYAEQGDLPLPIESDKPKKHSIARKHTPVKENIEMYNLFEQNDLFAQVAEEISPEEKAKADAEWEARKQAIEEDKKRKLEPRPFTQEIRAEYKEGTIVQDGKQYGYLKNITRLGAKFVPLELSITDQYRAAYYIPLREAYYNLYNTEAETQTEQPKLREELNVQYSRFFRMFKDLNTKQNAKFILMDVCGREILSLERFINGEKHRADIFTMPVSFNPNEISHVDTAQEALIASLNKFGYINLTYMSDLSDISPEELITELEAKIYFNPMQKNYEIADRFISGNVVAKTE